MFCRDIVCFINGIIVFVKIKFVLGLVFRMFVWDFVRVFLLVCVWLENFNVVVKFRILFVLDFEVMKVFGVFFVEFV